MKPIVIALAFLILTPAISKDAYTIKGIVKDKQTGETIPFAHVLVGEIINVSNIDGEFIISAADFDKKDIKLKVSYMGYESYSTPLSNLESYHTVFLEPSVTQLMDVEVYSGPSIMNEVFGRFHLNYEMERQHMVGYYQESMSDWEKTYYIAEGIMDIYTPSNLDKNTYPLVNPLRTRKKVFEKIDAIDEVLGGNASDMAQSSIWRKQSFLSPKNRKNYEYFYSGATSIGGHDVLIVEFEPRNTKGNTTGKLYVDENSFALIKIEYDPIINDFLFWESVTWTEEYEQRDGTFKLVSVLFKGTSTNNKYNYHALLVINESTPIDELPTNIAMMNVHDSFFEMVQEDFTDSFWTGFNFMKLDNKVTRLINSDTSQY
ncbi:carboxypeptidase-like regulatory domain-containing protein [Ekhidna sp. To15]|uniref:carboxypeptidase-like regulatory domain-containing protein n=1 Tax=Ekhidna sp. To15 TaxID=3395267 RepID=UPI003F526216